MTARELEARYRQYINCLNDRRLDELDQFVHEELIYNDNPMSRRDYRDLISGDIAAIPDLFFKIGLLVADDRHVACRLDFHCTPTASFLGLQPNGKAVTFSEHVFYRFRNGKIGQVWSLIDKASLAAQLTK